MDNPELLSIGGALVVALLLVVLVLRGRRGRAVTPDGEAEQADVEHFDQEYSVEAESTDESDESEPASEVVLVEEQVDLRSLKAQVRTLEEALERIQAEPVFSVSAEDLAAEESFRRQVAATLRGLGERTREDETPERTLARVAAAIERLDAPDDLTRPVLPTVAFDLIGHRMNLAEPPGRARLALPAAVGHAPVAVTFTPEHAMTEHAMSVVQTPTATMYAPEPSAPVMQAPVAYAPEPTVPAEQAPTMYLPEPSAPLEESMVATTYVPGSSASFEDLVDPAAEPITHEPTLSAPPEPDVVLPVPPPAPVQSQRQRRWGRHGA